MASCGPADGDVLAWHGVWVQAHQSLPKRARMYFILRLSDLQTLVRLVQTAEVSLREAQ